MMRLSVHIKYEMLPHRYNWFICENEIHKLDTTLKMLIEERFSPTLPSFPVLSVYQIFFQRQTKICMCVYYCFVHKW